MRRFHCQLNSALRQPSPAPPANRLVYMSNNAGDWPTKAVSNNSMTIAQVAEKRPVNLCFYLIPGKSKNNLVRAAAQLVLDSLQKAG